MICRFVWRLSILWIIRNACFGLKRQIICCQWVLMGPVVLYCPSQLCNGCRRQLQYPCLCSLCQCSSWHWALEGPQMIAFERDWVNAITWFRRCLGHKYDIRPCFKKIFHLNLYLLQITILGNVASLIGSVDDVRLVETVLVVNCLTVLQNKT